MKGNFVIKQLMAGPRLETLGDADGPFVFKRNTAAYAFLIVRLETRGVQTIIKEDDPEYPGCFDVLADFGGVVEQYAIEGKPA